MAAVGAAADGAAEERERGRERAGDAAPPGAAEDRRRVAEVMAARMAASVVLEPPALAGAPAAAAAQASRFQLRPRPGEAEQRLQLGQSSGPSAAALAGLGRAAEKGGPLDGGGGREAEPDPGRLATPAPAPGPSMTAIVESALSSWGHQYARPPPRSPSPPLPTRKHSPGRDRLKESPLRPTVLHKRYGRHTDYDTPYSPKRRSTGAAARLRAPREASPPPASLAATEAATRPSAAQALADHGEEDIWVPLSAFKMLRYDRVDIVPDPRKAYPSLPEKRPPRREPPELPDYPKEMVAAAAKAAAVQRQLVLGDQEVTAFSSPAKARRARKWNEDGMPYRPPDRGTAASRMKQKQKHQIKQEREEAERPTTAQKAERRKRPEILLSPSGSPPMSSKSTSPEQEVAESRFRLRGPTIS